jgi:hypothetical protein
VHLVVNVENLKLYEPSMLEKETNKKVFSTIEELAPKSQVELVGDTILKKKYRTIR